MTLDGTLADVLSRIEEGQSRQDSLRRFVKQTSVKEPVRSVQTQSGLFVAVDPHVEVFTTSGTTGSAFGTAATLDFRAYTAPGARLAYCEVEMESTRSGGDASDSTLAVRWRANGHTSWRTAKHEALHELTDDAEVHDIRDFVLPLGSSRFGEISVFETNDAWAYTLRLCGYQ